MEEREEEAEKSGGGSGVNEDEDEGRGGDEERRDRRRQHFWNTQTRWRRPDCTTLLESIRQSSLRTGRERRRSECGVKDEGEKRESERER